MVKTEGNESETYLSDKIIQWQEIKIYDINKFIKLYFGLKKRCQPPTTGNSLDVHNMANMINTSPTLICS